jgi:hypothetical protein
MPTTPPCAKSVRKSPRHYGWSGVGGKHTWQMYMHMPGASERVIDQEVQLAPDH